MFSARWFGVHGFSYMAGGPGHMCFWSVRPWPDFEYIYIYMAMSISFLLQILRPG